MANSEREQLWQERVAQFQASGLSQRAYAVEHGFSARQVSYWVRRLTGTQEVPGLLPVRVAPTMSVAGAITLRGEHGWTPSLPGDVQPSCLADLMRGL
ncbi:hypothetical protein KY495_12945 [Massilia sp. PAMC28688]|uniref:IS66 family insertion sequence element accessory protein TnpA n=1 Tax=Massilia sp. PAMC28688 TaxID=2861283 RepID=UPI001C63622D|nr:hypothetical protein [Massilia sp. PAMC28688]QYF91709.1 hypothetical protein KY495_12945 [Massilia sp. PAMC28688]